MGNINNLYEEVLNLTYPEIDQLVGVYHDPTTNCTEKSQALDKILKSFHGYFMKYVRLLKREVSFQGTCMKSSDTLEFLALFTSSGDRKQSHKSYSRVYKFVSQVCFSLEKEDIYNELCLRFIELLDSYKVYEGTSFTRYITKYLRWSIKSWIITMARDLNVLPLGELISNFDSDLCYQNNGYNTGPSSSLLSLITDNRKNNHCENQQDMIDLPELNLSWIVKPNNNLFEILSVYERFLLYLNFKENLGIRQIAVRLGKDKNALHRHLREAISKLRHEYLKEKGE